MRIGFVGAGRIGRPMVGRLLAAGHEVRVLGRTKEKRAALAAEGVTAAGDLTGVAEGAEAVLVCVYTDEQVRAVCLDDELIGALPAGATVVVHTTGSPRTVELIAARGVEVVDAPVSGGPPDVAAGRITLLVGGPESAVARMRPILGCYGDPVLHLGPLGAGQRVKLINNAVFAANIGLLREAVRLAGELGVAEESLLAALPHGSAASRALTAVAGRGSVAAFTEAVSEFLVKDVAVTRAVAGGLGADLGVLDQAIDVR
ncbi:MAG TPA: NAD(P)-dependent oxidoreductase [Pseudonocardiaceae bacterium]|jgi:3-hydroxyisobutyrate dehydrogenase-like beta-hydroxyacid dehydrogenase|nr:NAD(P)-dependent oxidoreductase [Pseudonocardiaceae bacterium]